MKSCLVAPLGALGFVDAYDLQRRLHGRVVAGEAPDMLLLVEHPHVYTLGRRGRLSDILADGDALGRLGVETHFTDRGGEVTYHGPGQIVGYPIVSLRRWGGGVREYVSALERMLIRTLAEFGIDGESEGKPTGVWVGEAKIAAIGVRVGRGVTMHGFALNVCPDLSFFDYIVPCGMPNARVTSVARELGRDVAVSEAMPSLLRAFGGEFGFGLERGGLAALDGLLPGYDGFRRDKRAMGLGLEELPSEPGV